MEWGLSALIWSRSVLLKLKGGRAGVGTLVVSNVDSASILCPRMVKNFVGILS